MGPNCVASSRSVRNDGQCSSAVAAVCLLIHYSSILPAHHFARFLVSIRHLSIPNSTLIVPPVQGSVVFTISDNNEQWYLDLKSEKPSAGKLTAGGAGGAPPNPDLSVKVSESDMIKMVRKELNPQQAFMKGRLKIKGKMALAMKLTSVLAATSRYLPKSKL